MAQLRLFQIASSPHSYGVVITPEIERALADHAPVAIGVSGGKDSSAVAIRTFEYLDDCGHRGPRLLVRCDLGEIERAESLPMCERLAASLGTELLVLRRGAGGLLARWQQRWESNKQRYAKLECVRVIMPWSSAAARFCTSELKTAIACRALAQRFVGRPILSSPVSGAPKVWPGRKRLCAHSNGGWYANAQGRLGGTGIRSSTGPMPKSLHFCGNETSRCISLIAFMPVLGFPARFVCFRRGPI